MTKDEEKEVIRVCGPDYEHSDIPAFIRMRDEQGPETEPEPEAPDEEGDDDEGVDFDYHPRPEEVNALL